MKVTRILVTLFLLAGVTSLAGAQTGTVNYYWDVCGSTATPANVNKLFAGPAIYKQVLSVTGLSGQVAGNQFYIVVGNGAGQPLADAWRFDAAGCNTGQFTTTSGTGVSKACPKLEGTNPLPLSQYAYDPTSRKAAIQLGDAYDNATAVGTTTYTLWILNFDHAFSATGPQDPAVACGNAEQPVCFAIFKAGILGGDNVLRDTPVGQSYVNWQDANNLGHCPGSVPAAPATWGRIKQQYNR